jgi:hypothetical protein
MAMKNNNTKSVSIIRKAFLPLDRVSEVERPAVLALFLRTSGLSDTESIVDTLLSNYAEPLTQQLILEEACKGRANKIHITGTIEERLFFVFNDDGSGLVCSLGRPLKYAMKDGSGRDIAKVKNLITKYIGEFEISKEQYDRLSQPFVLLVALHHPENFPMPRFALGISDIGRALRKQKIGRVQMLDMQLGLSPDDIVTEIFRLKPNIIGISTTFGQQDVMEEICRKIQVISNYKPLIVVGGSLAALNREAILRKCLAAMVANGAGELTMCDVVRSWIGDIPRQSILDVSFLDDVSNAIVETKSVSNRHYDDILPELDLLKPTLINGGVLQLESSRGCSYACSFCPREHKGIWAGEDADAIKNFFPEIVKLFDGVPSVAKRVFLVDEEFVGYENDDIGLERCLNFAGTMQLHGFDFETSSRIDQIVRLKKDKAWHIKRMQFWVNLVQQGLVRCLFGVESGVDSILIRFNKKTTSLQNILGIRTLSAIGIPIRITYITFDPLMTFDELLDSYHFLGRRDIFLLRSEGGSFEKIYDDVRDDGLLGTIENGVPFYHHVSYMLVSMEALIGSPYLTMVEQAGLAGDVNALMGRREVQYKDWRIGEISRISQLWVDRNFSLDYLLKSVEKISNASVKVALTKIRIVLRDAAYELFGLGLLIFGVKNIRKPVILAKAYELAQHREISLAGDDGEAILNLAFQDLAAFVMGKFTLVENILSVELRERIKTNLQAWATRHDWRLINGVCE